MDIVTHGMMGVIVASPFAHDYPLAAGAFMLGSAAPDLDALSRVFGKRAFLAAHQTYSHALPVIAAVGGATWVVQRATGFEAPYLALGLVLGMMFHSLLDVTNTYGIMLLAPFLRRRFCTEWIFFVDSVVIAATVPTLAWVIWRWASTGVPDRVVPAIYIAMMVGYWVLRILLRRRARSRAPAGTLSLIPSAIVPWQFFGCARVEGGVETFLLTAAGRVSERRAWPIRDEEWPQVRDLPEYEQMRKVSPAYHVVAAETVEGRTRVLCKDLRTRNFGARFGELEVVVDGQGSVLERTFHV